MSRMQAQIVQQHSQSYVGIDVGKSWLDIFIHPARKHLRIRNDRKSVTNAVKNLHHHNVGTVVLEATGSYHRLVHTHLHEAGFDVAVVNPFRARQFADSLGRLAKTDMIDAESLALFAERMKPDVTPPPGEQIKELRDLQTARRQIVQEIGDLKRRLQATESSIVRRQIKARIAMGVRHKDALEQEIQSLIDNAPSMKNKFDILLSIPGIGRTTAALLLSEMPELGKVNAKQVAALAGVAPMNRDSGSKSGARIIRGGRQNIRNALYMCAVSCIRRDNILSKAYRNLVGKGKNGKVAITAVMRKLIILANTLIAENRKFQKHYTH